VTPIDGTQTPALWARGLGFQVGGVEILADIDLSVPSGHFLGVIGPNGAGKTTFLNLLSGLLRPTAGTVGIEGREVNSLGPARRARLGVGRTFQTSSLFDSLSVFENARLSAEARLGGTKRFWHRPSMNDRASAVSQHALELVGLANVAGRPAASLSHGEKRKLELAILVAADARVLLLDEPMAGVNTEDVPGLTALISQLHREGRTVLMVEHHMAVVVGLVDSIAVLESGRLLAHGTPAEVVANDEVQRAYLGQPL
jgi:branched-chain amino acid transport system ATP-binding protein